MTVVRNQRDLASADDAALRETIVQLTGSAAPPGASRGALLVAASNAILSAQNAAGHLGVPRGTAPRTLTIQERIAVARAGGLELPMRAALATEIATSEPHRPKLVPAVERRRGRPRGTARTHVRAPSDAAPRANLQPGSVRAAVYAAVAAAPERRAAVADLQERFGNAVLGHIRKLLASEHLSDDTPQPNGAMAHKEDRQ